MKRLLRLFVASNPNMPCAYSDIRYRIVSNVIDNVFDTVTIVKP
jgi:hypothetical protein